jgi:hypothetical protein
MMPDFDSDVVLVGTGIAPLVAASHLLSLGRTVLVLNPDRDFFLEDSELPLEPFTQAQAITQERLRAQTLDETLRTIQPFFPGSVEQWPSQPSNGDPGGYYDALAPHVRSRARLWMPMTAELEDAYVEASDLGLDARILEGLQASRKFPGMALRSGGGGREPEAAVRALLVSRLSDVDVSRYRNGLLEFIRERLGRERVVCNASPIEPMPGGIRFHSDGVARTARLRAGTLVFWTPRLSSWVLAQARRAEAAVTAPLGARLWEQWSILSRDPIDPGVVGIWDQRMVVWADGEGAPGTRELAVLRAGPLVALDALPPSQGRTSWASAESFDDLASLCHEFLKWEKYTIRGLRPRAIFEWASAAMAQGAWPLGDLSDGSRVQIVPCCDGPLRDVVQAARNACDRIS